MKLMFRPCCVSLAGLFLTATGVVAEKQARPIFNGNDLSGWKIILGNEKPGEDPNGYVKVRDGAVHMYADTDPEGGPVPFGVILSEENFSRFHLTFQYRWGGKRFAPRKDALRDAGVLYHVSGAEKIWPDSVEYQIQEGDTGDIVFLPKAGITWMRPTGSEAPEGQGEPGLLPEEGGFPKDFGRGGFAYIGRFPELDKLEGWNEVEVIVQADEFAEHRINGQTVARISQIRNKDGTPAIEGKVALQLEGAEILYRDVKIRELDPPLKPDRGVVTLSGVHEKSEGRATLTVSNPTGSEIASGVKLIGKDADRFRVSGGAPTIAAGESATFELAFMPDEKPGAFSAGLQVGDLTSGVFVMLRGVGLAAFEGKNEPALQEIVYALGIPLDVGGQKLELDTQKDSLGESVTKNFIGIPEKKIRITPLARFSPTGEAPFGLVDPVDGKLTQVGALAEVSVEVPDAHQRIFPPLSSGAKSVEWDAPETPFAFYMEGPKFISFSDPAIVTQAGIPHTARVYPVKSFQGHAMENAYLVGFEEASNGDYQDAVFLIENIEPVR